MSVAEGSYRLTSLFEAELLLELMLRHWSHPLADDRDFRGALLESAAHVLREATRGNQCIEGLPAKDTNLVAAAWYAEMVSLNTIDLDDAATLSGRQQWLESIRRALPSCFCDPDLVA